MLSAKCSKSRRRGKCADICGKFVDMRGEKIYYVEAMNEFKDKKALFFDFDGTLWFGKYGEKTIETLKKLHDAGYILVYASGRSRGNTDFSLIKDIPFDALTFGGCTAEVFGKEIYRKDFSREQIDYLLNMPEKYLRQTVFEGVNGFYKYRGTLPKYLGEEKDDMNFLRNVKEYPLSKFSTIKFDDGKGGFVPIDEDVVKYLKEQFFVVELDHYIECMNKGHGKDEMVKKVCDYLGIPLKNTYCFGDSENDLAMFKAVNFGVAIAHAPESVKKLAKYVTKSDIDGVCEAVYALGLLK